MWSFSPRQQQIRVLSIFALQNLQLPVWSVSGVLFAGVVVGTLDFGFPLPLALIMNPISGCWIGEICSLFLPFPGLNWVFFGAGFCGHEFFRDGVP